MRLRIEAAGIAGVIAVVLAACGGSTKTGTQSSPAAASSTATSATTSTSSKGAAAMQYKTAFNTMTDADNAGIKDQNSSDSSTGSRAIQARINARHAFDSAVRAIAFPSSLRSDVQAVLRADASLELALGILRANVASVSAFNAALPTVKQAVGQFDAANATLGNALGLTGGGLATNHNNHHHALKGRGG
jgi:hypothetical protein